MEIQPVVIGTAGHIDHGKSSLVRALTGIDPDRWEEEKRRGMTIDLGFANFGLADGRRVGIVDVPGHERFVRNMVAGATGIDIALLVVAADDGVMPQTREHLAILGLVGVRRGVVALSKVDAVDPELAEMAREDVVQLLCGGPLEGARILPVSAHTGEGLAELRAELERLALETTPRPAVGPFRMPIQRVFSKAGFGTVVTGIPLSGEVRPGDELELLPVGSRVKARGLQAYGGATDRARAGHSTAVNVSDAERRDLARGDVLAAPGYFRAASLVAARFTALADLPKPLGDRLPVRLHAGTADPHGELQLLEGSELRPGQSALVAVRLAQPIVLAPGDRYLLRLLSPERTLGGGVVLLLGERRFKRNHRPTLEALRRQEAALGDPEALLAAALARRGLAPASPAELAREVLATPREVEARLLALRAQGLAGAPGRGQRWLSSEALADGLARLSSAAEDWFRDEPLRERVEVLELRRRTGLEGPVVDLLVAAAVEVGLFRDLGAGQLARPSAAKPSDPELERDLERAEAVLAEAALQPPSPEELAERLGLDSKRAAGLLARLVDAGRAVRISAEWVLHGEAYTRAREAVAASAKRHGHVEIPELRDGLATTRKWLIPLLEHFDGIGFTMRAGSHRVLRQR